MSVQLQNSTRVFARAPQDIQSKPRSHELCLFHVYVKAFGENPEEKISASLDFLLRYTQNSCRLFWLEMRDGLFWPPAALFRPDRFGKNPKTTGSSSNITDKFQSLCRPSGVYQLKTGVSVRQDTPVESHRNGYREVNIKCIMIFFRTINDFRS